MGSEQFCYILAVVLECNRGSAILLSVLVSYLPLWIQLSSFNTAFYSGRLTCIRVNRNLSDTWVSCWVLLRASAGGQPQD